MDRLQLGDYKSGEVVERYQYWRYRRQMEFRRCLPRVLFALITIAAIAASVALVVVTS